MERVDINFGPPKTFKEAMYRLPNDSHPQIDNDFEVSILSRVKREMEIVSKMTHGTTIGDRMITGLTEDSFLFMERWSFKRKGAPTRIYWDQKVAARSIVFNMIPVEKKQNKTLYVYDMVPELNKSWQEEKIQYKLICIEAENKKKEGVIDEKREYLLGFVTQEEYELLIGHEPSL